MTSKHTFKALAVLLIGILCFTKTYAQDSTKTEQPTEVRSLNKVRLNLLGLYYENEQKIGKQTTLYIGGGLAGTFLIEYRDTYYGLVTDSKTKTYFNLSPSVYAGIRKYYNFEKRIKKGKRTINNSGSYFGLDVAGYFSPLLKHDDYLVTDWEIGITPQWGFQHAMGKKTSFELSLGPAVRINEFETYYGIDGRIGFSFIF